MLAVGVIIRSAFSYINYTLINTETEINTGSESMTVKDD
jgi:hypothetical protein